MSEHGSQQLTGSERLQRRITVADLLTATAVGLWLVPLAFVLVNAPHDILILVVGLASTLALSTFVLGITLRARRSAAQWREKVAVTSLRRHNELVAQVAQLAASHVSLTRMVGRTQSTVDNGLAGVFGQLNTITGKLERKSWDIYADAITDLHGGPEVVNSQDTRRLTPRPGVSNVVQFPPTSGASNNGGF